jgi:hypothetical protein
LSGLFAETILGIPFSTYVLVGVVAALVSVIAGVAGYGTGLRLPLALVPAIGAETTVPMLGVTALL